jgi:Domain of unknown function (DUF4169)
MRARRRKTLADQISHTKVSFFRITTLERRARLLTSSVMSKIVNLRRARRQRARDEADAKAAENRAAHGRAKADKAHDEAESERASRSLDAHKRDTDE